MKNRFKISLVLFILISQVSLAQTYLQGNSVLPIQQMATSTLLNNNNRLTIQQAFTEINNRYNNADYSINSDKLVGEFFLINNMVVQLVNRVRTANNNFSPLEQTKVEFKEMFTNTLGQEDFSTKYYDELKNVNNYKVLIHYYKYNNRKNFIALDNKGDYVILGTIYCYSQDKTTAEAFVDTLLNSITFNP